MPAQTVLLLGPGGHEVVTMIDQQSHVPLGPVEHGDRQIRFAEGRHWAESGALRSRLLVVPTAVWDWPWTSQSLEPHFITFPGRYITAVPPRIFAFESLGGAMPTASRKPQPRTHRSASGR